MRTVTILLAILILTAQYCWAASDRIEGYGDYKLGMTYSPTGQNPNDSIEKPEMLYGTAISVVSQKGKLAFGGVSVHGKMLLYILDGRITAIKIVPDTLALGDMGLVEQFVGGAQEIAKLKYSGCTVDTDDIPLYKTRAIESKGDIWLPLDVPSFRPGGYLDLYDSSGTSFALAWNTWDVTMFYESNDYQRLEAADLANNSASSAESL